MENDPLNVEVDSHADGIGGDEDIARMVRIVEVLRLLHLNIRRKTAVDQTRLDSALLQFARDAVKIPFTEGYDGVT